MFTGKMATGPLQSIAVKATTFIASAEGNMYTTILAYVIAFLGLVMIGGGLWGLLQLWRHSSRPVVSDGLGPHWSADSVRIKIPLRNYAMAIGMICGGFGMIGIAQSLRVLVAIAHAIQPH
jgi:hypothetical protein